MSITLAGVFDSDTQAQAACRKLEQAGIDKRAIRVESGSSSSSPAAEPEDRRGFFQKLFGIGDDDASSSHYAEATRRGNPVVTVQLADENRVNEVSDILEDSGAVDVDQRVEQWKASGYVPPATGTHLAGTHIADGDDGQTMKSVEEDLKVGKRVVQKGRVRIHRSMTETPVEEQVTLRDEKASIERKKVDRPATDADMQAAFKDKDVEIRESSEEPVVSKSARVTEEVSVGKKSSDRTETVKDSVRSTHIDVENMGDVPASSRRTFSGPDRRKGAGGTYMGAERRASH